jgi:bifunctional pyridoxal-dependent enzyme with beta-cystathionase and maltose regulon repressor activities
LNPDQKLAALEAAMKRLSRHYYHSTASVTPAAHREIRAWFEARLEYLQDEYRKVSTAIGESHLRSPIPRLYRDGKSLRWLD